MNDESYTYWSAGEMRELKRLNSVGHNCQLIANILGRSEGAIKSRLYYLRIAALAYATSNNATLHTMKKELLNR